MLCNIIVSGCTFLCGLLSYTNIRPKSGSALAMLHIHTLSCPIQTHTSGTVHVFDPAKIYLVLLGSE